MEQVKIGCRTGESSGNRISGAEFLSGFRKDDRLVPVITLTVSFSHEPWDRPTSLHEMLAIENKELLKYVADYKLNLLTPHDIAEEDFDKFRTEFGAVMQCVKHRQDKDMKWMEGKDRFKKMTHGTASLIKTVTGFNLDLDKEGDVVNMMNAWENGLNQARNVAYADGRNDGRIESALMFAQKYNISTEEALNTAGVSKSEWDAYEAANNQCLK